jgi:aldose 1-epimerase
MPIADKNYTRPTVFAVALVIAALFHPSAACAQARTEVKQDWGKLPDGTAVALYTLKNKNGITASISTYGGIVTSLSVPDRNGKFADVVHGFDNLAAYLKGDPYFGAIVGRYGNRIAHAKFSLNGAEYKLAKNDGDNTLHGGLKGFDKVVWQANKVDGAGEQGVELTYLSKDGEEGFPGNLQVKVTYRLTDTNELRIEYAASNDKDTVLNLTNHSYFNLAAAGDILGHVVTLHAGRFTPVDKSLIPTGELKSVKGTPFDFTSPVAVGKRIEEKDEQLIFGKGYDHNWVIDGDGKSLAKAAEVFEPKSGRVLEVWTTQPGVQFYTGNFLDGTLRGKGGRVYRRRSALCLETQHFPDSPNQPAFPSTLLRKGATYHTTTVWKFQSR